MAFHIIRYIIPTWIFLKNYSFLYIVIGIANI